MTDSLDLDAYFQRIGYGGDTMPGLATLAAIHLAHVQSIGFENLDPLLRKPVALDIASLQRKLVHDGRGGYCFEQNALFARALRDLGFAVTGLAARVLWNQPDATALPRTHMLLRVDLPEGPFIADVGFGGVTLTGPLRLVPDIEQPTPHEPFRLIPVGSGGTGHTEAGECLRLDVKVGGDWTALYQFDQQPQIGPDYEMMNHYTATHPSSVFLQFLTAARPEPGKRSALRNNSLAVHYLDGRTERRTLASGDEIRAALAGVFALTLPDDPGLDRILEDVAAGSR